jgi:DNA-binding transcriptional LysR family regulator
MVKRGGGIYAIVSFDHLHQYNLYVLLAQLAAFIEVARTRSVSRAADSLFVTQPALTARLQRLEADLGAKLFVRTPRGMRLTEAGEAFLPYAVRALETLADGRRLVNAFERGGAGTLVIGAAPAVSTYVLPRVLKTFAVGHPRVAVSVRTGHSEEVLELVLREQVDVGLVRTLRHPEIESIPLYEDRLILVTDPGHRLAVAGRTPLEEIGREQLILFDRTSSYHDVTSALFRRAGVVPLGVMELDNIDAAKKMVQEGFGVALLPHTAVEDELRSGSLREVDVADAEPPRREIVAIRRRDGGPPAGTVAAFLATLEGMRPELSRAPRRPGEAPRRAGGRRGRSRARGRAPSR